MRYRISFDDHEEVIEDEARPAAHAFRRIVKRRGFSPFLIEAYSILGDLKWDLEFNDPDLWLERSDFEYLAGVGASALLVRLVFLNGNLCKEYPGFRHSELDPTQPSEPRRKK